MKLLNLNDETGHDRRMGMGALHLSLAPRPAPEDAIAVVHHALRLGIHLFDTADSYCADESDKNHSEALIRRALDSYSGDTHSIVIATKGGMIRPNGRWVRRGDPEYLQAAILRSFEALGGHRPIDLWQLHAPDPHFSMKQSLRAAVEAMRNGLVRWVGLSNVTVDQIKEAREVVGIVAVQNQYNLWHRDSEFNGVIEYCESAGISFLPWAPMGGKGEHHLLARTPFFGRLAAEHQVSVYSIILAWVLAKSHCIIPIPGTSKPQHMDAWMDALHVKLTPQELFRMECSVCRTPGLPWFETHGASLKPS